MDHYDIVLIEAYPCNSKDERHTRERYYTQLLPCANKIKNQGLIKEIGVKEYKKLSYETSIDKIKATYQINKEQILYVISTINNFMNVRKVWKQYTEIVG